MSVLTDTPVARSARTIPIARLCAALAAALFVLNGVVGLLGGDKGDHYSGWGMVSEVTAGLGFLAGGAVLAVLVTGRAWQRALWWLAPVGMAIAGVTMLGVPVVGQEPAEWLFVLAVLPTFVGQVAAGVIGSRRVWPVRTGVAVALFLPIMFLAPFNGFLMAAVWVAVGLTARRPAG